MRTNQPPATDLPGVGRRVNQFQTPRCLSTHPGLSSCRTPSCFFVQDAMRLLNIDVLVKTLKPPVYICSAPLAAPRLYLTLSATLLYDRTLINKEKQLSRLVDDSILLRLDHFVVILVLVVATLRCRGRGRGRGVC